MFLRCTDLLFLNSRFHSHFFVIFPFLRYIISETPYHQLKFEKKATHFVDLILGPLNSFCKELLCSCYDNRVQSIYYTSQFAKKKTQLDKWIQIHVNLKPQIAQNAVYKFGLLKRNFFNAEKPVDLKETLPLNIWQKLAFTKPF